MITPFPRPVNRHVQYDLHTLAALLRRRYPVRVDERNIATSTALCHGGNSPYGLSIGVGRDTPLVAQCWTHGCHEHDHAGLIRRILGAAGLDTSGEHYRPPPPAPAPPPRSPRQFQRPQYPAPRGVSLLPQTGWPDLPDDDTSFSDALQTIPGRWTAWLSYMLPDGRIRDAVREFPSGWRGWDSDRGRPTAGHDAFLLGDRGSPICVIGEGEKAAVALHRACPELLVAAVPGTAALANALTVSSIIRQAPDVRHLLLWPDADAPGVQAAHKAADEAARLMGESSALESVQVLAPDPAVERGWDAADAKPSYVRSVLYREIEKCMRSPKGLGEGDPTPVDPYRGEQTFFEMPPRTAEWFCIGDRQIWMWAESADGEPYVQGIPCGKCERCMGWQRHLDILRYERGRGEGDQTIVRTRHISADAAAAWRAGQHRRVRNALGDGLPVLSLLGDSGDPLLPFDLTMVYADTLPDAVRRGTQRAVGKGGGTMQDRAVGPMEIADLMPEFRTVINADGDHRRRSICYANWRAAWTESPDDFGLSDPLVGPLGHGEPEPEEQMPAILRWRRMRGIERARYLHALDWWRDRGVIPESLWERMRADGAEAWMERVRVETGYRGPTALIEEALGCEQRGGAQPAWARLVQSQVEGRDAYQEYGALSGGGQAYPCLGCGGWHERDEAGLCAECAGPPDCGGCGMPYYPVDGAADCPNCEDVLIAA